MINRKLADRSKQINSQLAEIYEKTQRQKDLSLISFQIQYFRRDL